MTPLLDIFGRPHKTCPSCGYLLSFEKFYPSSNTLDGIRVYCKKCERKRKQDGKTQVIERI